jgi:hypothetical protein
MSVGRWAIVPNHYVLTGQPFGTHRPFPLLLTPREIKDLPDVTAHRSGHTVMKGSVEALRL